MKIIYCCFIILFAVLIVNGTVLVRKIQVSVICIHKLFFDLAADSDSCKFFQEKNKILVGYAQQILSASDINSCRSLCSTAATKLKFTCLSGSFYAVTFRYILTE